MIEAAKKISSIYRATDTYNAVVEANIALHSNLADHYNSSEPHFRSENLSKVESILKDLAHKTDAKRLLDLGCGTGFIINLAKNFIPNIDGVDVTQAMLDKIDRSGNSTITTYLEDVASFTPKESSYDLVTAYSFLHHLYDVMPALKTANKALRTGGMMYVDLEPNYFMWAEINKLPRDGEFDQVIKREIEAISFKDEDIEKNYGVSGSIFNQAEYYKNIRGGFTPQYLEEAFIAAGFTKVEVTPHWFLGEGSLINDKSKSASQKTSAISAIYEALNKALPVSQSLFKYLRVIATK